MKISAPVQTSKNLTEDDTLEYGSRAGWPVQKSHCVVIFMVEITVRLYGQAGWPGC
jgi:hypothetical protein